MKKLFVLIALTGISYLSVAQTDAKSCDKSSCGPEGTKKGEAAVITTMRTDLETVIAKMSKSSISFDKTVADMKVAKGTNDDECLLYISQAASTIRYELVSKVEGSKLIAPLKNYKPASYSTKQQMVSALINEIQILASQVEKL